MKNKKLFIVAISGIVGFLLFTLARFIFMRVVISHFFGSALSSWEKLIIFVFVPIMIILGASIPAWALGASWWHRILAGTIAMGVTVLVLIFGDSNYSPFNDRETLQFVSPVCVTVLIANITRKDRLPLGKIVVFIIIIAFLSLKLIIPEYDIKVDDINFKIGFLISLLAWTMLPPIAAFFTTPKQGG